MRKLATVVVILVGLAILGWNVLGGAASVADAILPDFPDLPSPPTQLASETQGEIYFESHTPYDFDVLIGDLAHALATTGLGTLVLPDADRWPAPWPAMVLLHGSGGISPGREMETAAWLAEHGIAGFVVDYYRPRGITDATNYMVRVLSVTEFDATADGYGALRLLEKHPSLDPAKIGIMGFSYGGMATRIAMDERVRKALAPTSSGFSAFADVYGPCFQDFGTRVTNGAPLLTLRGTEDASNELSACADREDELRQLGVSVTSHVFEGAGHAWEADIPRELRPSPYVSGCTFAYDESGHPFVNGAPISQHEAGTSRAERSASRVASGAVLGDCVGEGYIIGRDDATRAKAEAALLSFLRETWSLPKN